MAFATVPPPKRCGSARGRDGSGATDPFELERIDPNERDIITARVDESEAHRIAERYTGYVLRNRRRAFVAPTIEVLSCQMVHKPFWIVTTRSLAQQPSLRVLVDGITGGLHPLSSEDEKGVTVRLSPTSM